MDQPTRGDNPGQPSHLSHQVSHQHGHVPDGESLSHPLCNLCGVSLRPVLVNTYEESADIELRRACEHFDARVYAKVRLGDVIDLSGINLTYVEFNYAAKAHLDFVVCDVKSFPLLAVEMDGRASHANPAQAARDRMKDSICARACLPMMRAENHTLRRFGPRFRLLGWLVQVWFMGKAFDEAHERGELDEMADFDPNSFIEPDPESGGLRFSFDVAAPIRIKLMRLFDERRLVECYPEEIGNHRAADDEETVAYQVLPVANGLYLIAEASCQSNLHLYGVAPVDLASDLAILDLDEQVDAYLRGEPVAVAGRTLDELRERTSGERWVHQGVCWCGRDSVRL
jgi:hypothetical protein